MDEAVVRRIDLILAKYTKVIGMQAGNIVSESQGQSQAYSETEFSIKA